MYFKAKYDDITETGDFFKNKSQELDSHVGKVNSLLVELEKYWNGKDYVALRKSYSKRIGEVSVSSNELNALGKALCKVGLIYSSADGNFENKVEKMRKDKNEV